MLTVHHLNNSRSQRILWLLEELGVDYEVRRYERNAKTQLAPASLRKIHPLGKSPIVEDALSGVTLAESGAIIDYLVRTYGKTDWMPAENTHSYWQYSYWLHFSEGSLMPPLVMRLVFERIKKEPMPIIARPVARKIADTVMDRFVSPNISSQFDYIEAHLSDHDWFCGAEISGADIQMSFPLEASVAGGLTGSDYPAIQAWVKKVQARPAYQAALETGGEYAYA